MDIKKLREEFATLDAAQTVLINFMAERDLTDAEKASKESNLKRMTQINEVIAEDKKRAALAFEKGEVEMPAAETVATKARVEVMDSADKKTAYKEAFNKFFRTGEIDNRFTTTGSTNSGILLPTSVTAPTVLQIPNAFRQAFARLGLSTINTPTSQNLNWVMLDVTSGSVVTPGATSESLVDPDTTASFDLNVKTYQSGNRWYDNMELLANPFDLLEASLPAAKVSKERIFQSDTVSTIVADSSISTISTGSTVGFQSSTGYGVFNSIDTAFAQQYNNNKVILLSKSAYASAQGLVDSQNRPIFTPDAQNQNLRSILGTPVIRCDDFAAFGSNNVVGAVFSLDACMIRDVGDDLIIRFVGVPTHVNATGVAVIGYSGFGYASAGVRLIKCPVS